MCNAKHNPEYEEYGWCHTKVPYFITFIMYFFSQGNYYVVGNENYNEKSWGFCGKDCYLDADVPSTGVLRMKENIHILPDQLCETFLNISLKYETKVEIHQVKEGE